MKRLLCSFICIVLFFSLAGCTKKNNQNVQTPETIPQKDTALPQPQTKSSQTNDQDLPALVDPINLSISLYEVSRHNTPTDCWVVINAQVYQATNYIQKYPNDEIVVAGCGEDISGLFEQDSTEKQARGTIKSYYLGELRL